MSRHAFIDESRWPEKQVYIMCAVSFDSSEVVVARKRLREALPNGVRDLHTSRQSEGVTKQLLNALGELGTTSVVVVGGIKEKESRPLCLAALIADVVADGAARVILDSTNQAHRDRQVIRQELARSGHLDDVSYSHLTGTDEELLGAPDAIAWAYGKGGRWRREAQPLIREVIKL